MRARTITETLAERTLDAAPPVREYTTKLVKGVIADLPELDRRISDVLTDGWTLERMPRVDRAIARIATWEIDHRVVEPAVAISEAKVLAGQLSTDESPAFLHGVLSAVARTRPEVS